MLSINIRKRVWRSDLKKFSRILILAFFLASSIQGCSWVSQQWDERPSWMGGETSEE